MNDDFMRLDFISADERCGRRPNRWFPMRPILLAFTISIIPALIASAIHHMRNI